MLNWANRFNICTLLDNHDYQLSHHSVDCLLAAGLQQGYTTPENLPADEWLFGHLSYDLKNHFEQLSSANPDGVGFPDCFFYAPRYVLRLGRGHLEIGSPDNDHQAIFDAISALPAPSVVPQRAMICNRMSREEYVQTVHRIQEHIRRGDCYELNFCQEFFGEGVDIDPLSLYVQLSASSPNPFSAYYKLDDKYALCFSPERYLRKEGGRLISQPIKGTAGRSTDPRALKNNLKERAENIMVVDLVRNDLSRVCGDVRVDELCGIYSFPQVHQMISTVSGQLNSGISFSDIVRATFPMGSMTGVPKKRVMELIEQYERTRRGLFSGSIGYITPGNDFDFNVVIRTVFYQSTRKYLSFQTGSAITAASKAEQEYEECLLKAAAIKKALAETNTFH